MVELDLNQVWAADLEPIEIQSAEIEFVVVIESSEHSFEVTDCQQGRAIFLHEGSSNGLLSVFGIYHGAIFAKIRGSTHEFTPSTPGND
ncbi:MULTISPECIES: hypothetical protein [Herbaspirillum]|uniref:hypothetical protein n=1 Tax=Herbaspirillum TaxID=963 RepID=UPI0015C5323F|nr:MULTISPECIES: hypothetical protein [Herbaspirillum]